jgi:hypothetical protein
VQVKADFGFSPGISGSYGRDVAVGNLMIDERHIQHSSQIIVNILVSLLKN